MHTLAITFFIVAVLVMVFAVFYQRRDLRPGHGNTMGGEMTSGVLWLFASLLCAIGSFALIPWYFAVLVFFGVLALSFLVRRMVALIPKRES